MARPVYPYELDDPDYYWLVNNFEENNSDYDMYCEGAEPVVFIKFGEENIVSDLSFEELTKITSDREAKK